jgi:hypothetical protein
MTYMLGGVVRAAIRRKVSQPPRQYVVGVVGGVEHAWSGVPDVSPGRRSKIVHVGVQAEGGEVDVVPGADVHPDVLERRVGAVAESA